MLTVCIRINQREYDPDNELYPERDLLLAPGCVDNNALETNDVVDSVV